MNSQVNKYSRLPETRLQVVKANKRCIYRLISPSGKVYIGQTINLHSRVIKNIIIFTVKANRCFTIALKHMGILAITLKFFVHFPIVIRGNSSMSRRYYFIRYCQSNDLRYSAMIEIQSGNGNYGKRGEYKGYKKYLL